MANLPPVAGFIVDLPALPLEVLLDLSKEGIKARVLNRALVQVHQLMTLFLKIARLNLTRSRPGQGIGDLIAVAQGLANLQDWIHWRVLKSTQSL
jgi:hypothetical protein